MAENHAQHLAHHFDSAEQQFESGKLGMWLFLATEILLFGGLFCAYAVYRANHPEIFVYAHRYLDKVMGGINTGVLIFSSLTMAWAVRAAQKGQQRALKWLLAVTIACGFVFLGIKFVEYQHKWKEGLLWGKRFAPHAEGATAVASPASPPALAPPAGGGEEGTLLPQAAPGPAGLARADAGPARHESAEAPKNVQIFFGVYFTMTGLHGVHVIAGMVLLGAMLVRAVRGDFGPEYFTPVDLTGLYWHLVDLIWIFLFPLLYLIH
ncbi:MAG: cytochrome c oxidase subunit 3 family protein [Acidobacteriota bacterium]